MQNNQIILLSGTPGTGKTSIAIEIEKKYSFQRISLGEMVVQHNLYSEEDERRDTKVIDMEKFDVFFDSLLSESSNNILVEGHYSDLINHPKVRMAIILRCHPKVLFERLKKRDYSKEKIRENIQAELVGDCTSYMLEKKKLLDNNRIFELDTTAKTETEIMEIIIKIIRNPENYTKYKAGQLSWLSDPTVAIEEYLD